MMLASETLASGPSGAKNPPYLQSRSGPVPAKAGGATMIRISFQHPRSDPERDTAHVNLQELRAAGPSPHEPVSPGNIIGFHLNNIKAIAYTRKRSRFLSAESRKLWL